jgi:hypothetical protein
MRIAKYLLKIQFSGENSWGLQKRLARKYGVSEATISRDMAALAKAGGIACRMSYLTQKSFRTLRFS